MLNNNFFDLYHKFGYLDNNTQIFYIFLFLILLFMIFNFIPISQKLIHSLIIAFVIFIMFLSKQYNRFDRENKNISKINTSLDLKNFKYISHDLDICAIYLDIIDLKKIDKYSYMNSLIETDKFMEIYNDIKNKNTEYSQLLDIAKEKKDSALNHLISISNSINPNIGIISNTNTIVQNPLEDKLINKINELRVILNEYWFEMLNISRIIYETTTINTMSKPIIYDINEPNPNTTFDGFDIYYGNIDP
jgi:hypothetical protein